MFELQADFQLQPINFNFEVIKAGLAEKLEVYQGLIVSDDAVKAAKSDRAMLNKLRDELKARRIAVKKDFLKPYDEFESKVNELIAMIEKPVMAIDGQIKAFEDAAKEEKRAELLAHYDTIIESPAMAGLLPFERVFKLAWLNASISIKKAKEELTEAVKSHQGNVHLIREMKLGYEQEVLRTYLDTLDMSAALRKKSQLEEQAKLVEVVAPPVTPSITLITPPVAPPTTVLPDAPEPSIMDFMREIDPKRRVDFKTWITPEDQAMIEQFFTAHGIRYKVLYWESVEWDGKK